MLKLGIAILLTPIVGVVLFLLFFPCGLNRSVPDVSLGSTQITEGIPAYQRLKDNSLRPFDKNPLYWQYKNKPIVLLGASNNDNPFQNDDFEQQIDDLARNGGNYIRLTLSSRDEHDVWPHQLSPQTGLYDLSKFSTEYFERIEKFLQHCYDRDVIAQIEFWDRFDFARAPWEQNPFNPKNNSNYDSQQSGLKTSYPRHPSTKENAFFRSAPSLENNGALLGFQLDLVDRVLDSTLKYPNVLYSISNETTESLAWVDFWAKRIQERARDLGKEIAVTEMWNERDLRQEIHKHVTKRHDLYSFVEISQNNHHSGYLHWERIQVFRTRIVNSEHPRPLNMIKVYGANTNSFGDNQDGQERFWRALIGGVSSVRFHRPSHGIGASNIALANLKSARMLLDQIDIFSSIPDAEVDLKCARANRQILHKASDNEAYATYISGKTYAVYFPTGGSVELELPKKSEQIELSIRWLDIATSQWMETARLECADKLPTIRTPHPRGSWVALVRVNSLE